MIVTFYSYKGGVGRTMALANIAVALAESGATVLAVDFDLEAPGLYRYMQQLCTETLRDQPGVVDLLTAIRANPSAVDRWTEYPVSLDIPRPGKLAVLTSGRQDDDYGAQVLDFDWHTFFAAGGGELIERLRAEWQESYDYILLDSRTGVTDTGGVCTIQLPDVIVPVVSANEQSLYGAVEVVRRAQLGRKSLVRTRGDALIFPLVSRFDDRTEHELARKWLDVFAMALGEFYDPWLPVEFQPRQIIERTKLPYVSYYSFGETLPVTRDSATDFGSLGFALRTSARLINQHFDDIGILLKEVAGEGELAPAARLDQFLAGMPTDIRRRALNVLIRLVEADGAALSPSNAVPVDLLGDEAVIATLLAGQILVQHGSAISLADSALVDSRSIRTAVEGDRELLAWSRRVRHQALERLDFVLEVEDLAEAVQWYSRDASSLTPFELRLIEVSRRRRAKEVYNRVRASRRRLLPVSVVVGLSLGLTAGAIVESALGLAMSAVIIGAGVGGYAGSLVGLVLGLARRRLLVISRGVVDLPNDWASRHALAVELSELGYRARSGGEVVAFELREKRRAIGGPLGSLAVRYDPAESFAVIVQPGQGGLSIEGPRFVLRHIGRVFEVSEVEQVDEFSRLPLLE